MTLLQNYTQGNTIQVYEEITRMGQDAFEKHNLRQVNAVLRETMTRVAYNLEVIYNALLKLDYCLKSNPRNDFEYPLLKPGWRTDLQIAKVKKENQNIWACSFVATNVLQDCGILQLCVGLQKHPRNPLGRNRSNSDRPFR